MPGGAERGAVAAGCRGCGADGGGGPAAARADAVMASAGVGPAGREKPRVFGEEGLTAARCGLRKSVKKSSSFDLRVDPFSKKDWYDVKAPAMFNIRNIGKTLVTRTQGTKIASDGLKGRVFEVSLADLQNDEVAFRKFKLITEDVQGKNCLTNFHGMDLTRDKMCSMVKKWQTMIEAHVDVKTTDGYLLRLFCVGFTKKRNNQIRKTSYAQHQQVRQIRKKMMEIMTREVQTNDLKEVVNKL
ncbi:hypothetical protein Nmel_006950 [Mimus melanotis]